MVLKKILPNIKDQRGKWVPNYEGSYKVKHVFSRGVLIQTDAEVSPGRQNCQTPNDVQEWLGKSSTRRSVTNLWSEALGQRIDLMKFPNRNPFVEAN
ncbi:hypothetical protein CR513_14760, partial [Mucuna pruriens]